MISASSRHGVQGPVQEKVAPGRHWVGCTALHPALGTGLWFPFLSEVESPIPNDITICSEKTWENARSELLFEMNYLRLGRCRRRLQAELVLVSGMEALFWE